MPKSPSSGQLSPERFENVACPFCPLLCDDLVIDADGDDFRVVKHGCGRANVAFQRPRPKPTALVDGVRVSHTAAIGAATAILKRARAPLISGLGTDVDGIREAVAVAERARAILDHGHSAGTDRGMRVLQSRGWYMTTLAEVRNRADLIVLVGADVVSEYANFLRRVAHPAQTLVTERRKQRRIVYIGDKRNAPKSTRSCPVDTIPATASNLAESMSLLRGLVAGAPLPRGGRARQFAPLAQAIRQAAYPVFVWAPGQLAEPDADLTISATTRLVDDLNETQRAAGLALGGGNGGISAANACAWLTGYPLHVSFAGRTIEYDPVRYQSARLIENGMIDTLLWIDAFGEAPLPATDPDIKRIAIGDPGQSQNLDADVFIPVGTPGIDYKARLVRTDSVVTLRLDQLRRKSFASAATVLREIMARW